MRGLWSTPRHDRRVTSPSPGWTRRGVLAAGAAGVASACTPGHSSSPPRALTSTAVLPHRGRCLAGDGRRLVPAGPARRRARSRGPGTRRTTRCGCWRTRGTTPPGRSPCCPWPRRGTWRPRWPSRRTTTCRWRCGRAATAIPGWSAGDGGGVPRSLVLDSGRCPGSPWSGAAATIGAGAALAQVYDAVGSHGRAVAGGSCATVGIAGLTLGRRGRRAGPGDGPDLRRGDLDAGGHRGPAGPHRRAPTRTPDLFWALRGGGGGHLGVVTSFTMATSTAPTISSVFLQWPLSAASDVVPGLAGVGTVGRRAAVVDAQGARRAAAPRRARCWCWRRTWTGRARPSTASCAGCWTTCRRTGGHARRTRAATARRCSPTPAAWRPGRPVHHRPGRRADPGAVQRHLARGLRPADRGRRRRPGRGGALSAGGPGRGRGVSLDALGGRVRDLAPGDTAFVHRTRWRRCSTPRRTPPARPTRPPTPTCAASGAG